MSLSTKLSYPARSIHGMARQRVTAPGPADWIGVDMFELTTCVMVDEKGRDCRHRRAEDAPLPLCLNHLRDAYLFFADYLASVRDRTEDQEADFSKAGDLETPFTGIPESVSIVYYVRIGNHIKIGMTRNLHERMGALQPDEILAIEEGGRDKEMARHQQFTWSKAPKGAEYFYPTDDLMRHIDELRKLDWKPPKVVSVPGWVSGRPCPSCDLVALWFDGERAKCTDCGAVHVLEDYPPVNARIVAAC
jgi:hypothetical protein